MVLYKQGELLYKGVTDLVIEHLNKLAQVQIIPTFPTGTKDIMIQSSEDELLLKALKNVWDDHRSSMVRLGQILKYMVSSGYLMTTAGLIMGTFTLGSRPYKISKCSNDRGNGANTIFQTYHQVSNQGPRHYCRFESSQT